MSRLRIRFTIGRIMAGIALFAIALTVLHLGLVISGSIILALVGLVALGSAITGAPWSQVTAWICATYPVGVLMSVYFTWLTAWLSLGHRPRFPGDDPESINLLVTLVYATAFWMLFLALSGPALVFCVGFVITEAVGANSDDRPGRGRVGMLVTVAILSWSALFLVLNMDPGRVLDWFMD